MFIPVSHRAAAAYRRVSLDTSLCGAPPQQLVSLLFEALLQSLGAAQAAISRGDQSAKGAALGRAVRILEEGLRAGLNPNAGGDLAAQLDTLYRYSALRLTQANLRSDSAAISEVDALIRPLAQAWSAISSAPERRAA